MHRRSPDGSANRRVTARGWLTDVRITHLSVAIGLAISGVALAAPPKPQWKAPPSADQTVNPVKPDAASIAAGKRIYTATCFACHGKSGKGDGPAGRVLKPHPGNLSDPAMWEQSDGALFWKITHGHAPMPTFKAMPERDRWNIINYIRTLAPKPAVTTPRFSAPDTNRDALSRVFRASLGMQAALANNDPVSATKQIDAIGVAIDYLVQVEAQDMDTSAREQWRRDVADLKAKADALAAASTEIGAQRAACSEFSRALVTMLADFGHMERSPVVVFEATAHGNTKVWAQSDTTPQSPFGSRVGKPSIRERLASQ